MDDTPLIERCGAAWDIGAPAVALAWAADGDTLAFALGSGEVARADTQWFGDARTPPPRPRRTACHKGACLAIVPLPGGGFASAGDDGQVLCWPPDAAAPRPLATAPGAWIDLLAASAEGRLAWAAGRRLWRREADGATTSHALPAGATALAFSPDGRTLAAAHAGGVTRFAAQGPPATWACRGLPRTLAWHPGGEYLVAGLQENALHGWRCADGGTVEIGGYPGQPLSIAFSHDGRWLASSGAPAVTCWRFDPPRPDEPPGEAGPPAASPVQRVACHPTRPLVAAGDHEGRVWLCQPGRTQALALKGRGRGAVQALAWSPDGGRLALATRDGLLGWLPLPVSPPPPTRRPR